MDGPGRDPRWADLLFRREAGRMVAILTRIFGTENLQTAEDVVQETLILAVQTWKSEGPPDNPAAWLFRVAKNKAIDVIRRQRHSIRFDFSDHEKILLNSEYTLAVTMESFWKEESVEDDLLGMMFACCHPGLSGESQIALILKTLCGFSSAEIAHAFLTSEDTIGKRLYRAKEFFRAEKIKPEIPADAELQGRLDPVLNAIYLLFNEGYRTTRHDSPIRTDLMGEALHLGNLLAGNPHTQAPRVFALMALMCFHISRNDSRVDSEGALILLPDQNRALYDFRLIAQGNAFMNRAASGEALSAYHIEAAIAFEHCRAESYADTDWPRILEYYGWLCRLGPNPMAELNRIIVALQVYGPESALEQLEALHRSGMPGAAKLEEYSLYHALAGEIHGRLGDAEKARAAYGAALERTQSEAERQVIRGKLARLGPVP